MLMTTTVSVLTRATLASAVVVSLLVSTVAFITFVIGSWLRGRGCPRCLSIVGYT
jgi:hypothetical protein